jgi:hypothetical protein
VCDEGEGKPNPAFYSGQLGLAAMIQQALARRPTGPSHQTRQRADDLGITIHEKKPSVAPGQVRYRMSPHEILSSLAFCGLPS